VTDAPDPIDLAARALRHCDRSRRQVEERLERAGVAEESRHDALDTLERVGYVDAERFAVTRAASLAARGYGDEGIRHLLEADGAPATAITAALARLPAEAERAAGVVRAKGRSTRTAARLARKGFSEESVEAALGAGFADDAVEA
jgi:SOS response regulatory protein OraA/RecX